MRRAAARVSVLATLASLAGGCAPRARMCTASTECVALAACVAGRCQPERENARPARPAIDTARRVVVRATELAYLRRGNAPSGGALPPLFALGRDSAVLMMRFAVALPSTAKVVEAYVVLRRSDAVDDDPAPVSLHATRIVEGWQGRSISWARQPKVVDTRAPATLVEPGGPAFVRLDVLDFVRHWARHDERDQGIAIVADNETRTGTTFAFRSLVREAADLEPYLELYLR